VELVAEFNIERKSGSNWETARQMAQLHLSIRAEAIEGPLRYSNT